MGGLMSKPKAPPPPPAPEPVTPMPDPEASGKQAQKDYARRTAKSGRQSTILSGNSGGSDKLGG